MLKFKKLPKHLSFLSNPNITLKRLNASTSTTSSSPSINPHEISHFSRLSSQWWNERGEFNLLHKMNPPRMNFIRDTYLDALRDHSDSNSDSEMIAEKRARSARPFDGLQILDIGCGGGLLSESLSRLGAQTLGIDASQSNINIASIHSSHDPSFSPPGPNILSYRHCSAESLLLEKGDSFDVVCCMEVLEHVDEPAGFLRTCGGLVKPGGQLILSTISRTPLSYMLTILAAEHILKLVEPNTHTYSKFIKPSELIAFFHNEGWIGLNNKKAARTEVDVRGIVYIPWTAEWRLMRDVTECNYIISIRKPKYIT